MFKGSGLDAIGKPRLGHFKSRQICQPWRCEPLWAIFNHFQIWTFSALDRSHSDPDKVSDIHFINTHMEYYHMWHKESMRCNKQCIKSFFTLTTTVSKTTEVTPICNSSSPDVYGSVAVCGLQMKYRLWSVNGDRLDVKQSSWCLWEYRF